MRTLAIIGAVISLLAAQAAVGQQPTAAPVRSDTGGNENEAADVEEIVIRGFRLGRLESDPSAFGSVIATADYEAERKSVEDLLAAQTGVQIRRFGGPGEAAEVSIRGSTSSQVAVLLDGVPINSVLSGKVDLSQVCLGLIDTVEVSRGGGAVREGSGAMGGIVNLVTRRPGVEPVNRASASGGAFGTWQASTFRSARAGPLEYAAGYCGFTTEGDYSFARPVFGQTTLPGPPVIKRVNNRRERHSASLSLGGDITGGTHLRFRNYVTYSSHGEPGLASGSGITGGQDLEAHGRNTHNLAQLDWSTSDRGRLGDEILFSAYHRYQRDHYRNPGEQEDDEPTDTLTRVSTFGISASSHWRRELLAADHRLSLKLTARRDSLYADGWDNRGRTTTGVMLAEDARFFDEWLTIVPALRLDWTQGFGATWLPSLGAVISPLRWIRLKSNIEKSFRTPSFDELFYPDKGFIEGDPNLSAESARNADVGLELVFARVGPIRNARLSGGFFHQQINESIVWMQVSPNKVMPVNTGEVQIQGYEVGLSLSLTTYLTLSANRTGLTATGSNTGAPLVGRAESETNFRAELGRGQAWKLVAELQHTSEIPTAANGSSILPARSVWNANAAVDLVHLSMLGLDRRLTKLWLFVQLNNIGDVAVLDGLYFPQPGRNGHLGLEVEW